MPEPALTGLRVVDLSRVLAGPYCTMVLADLGADVIKVEAPDRPDPLRSWGRGAYHGRKLWWPVHARGKRLITLDLRSEHGQELFLRLVACSDVVLENFRPGTLERWNIGPGDLDPSLVLVRISVFGQDGPYAQRPGLDRMGIGYGGLMHLTGYADRPPVRPGVTISDYLTGSFAASAAVAALYRRDARQSGQGAVIDACLYGSVLRVLEWTLAGYDKLGVVREREGNRLANSAPLDNYPTADGTFVCIVAGSDTNFRRLCKAMGRPELAADARFATLAQRAAAGEELNDLVTAWTSSMTAAEVEAACVAADVPVARVFSSADVFADPHMAARGDLVTVADPVLGDVRQQAPVPRFDGVAPDAPSGAPRLGEHNDEVWTGLVGLSGAELEGLRSQGVV